MNMSTLVGEFKKDIPCFVCGKTDIVSLRGHIRNVHKEIIPSERRRLMKENRRLAILKFPSNDKNVVVVRKNDKTMNLTKPLRITSNGSEETSPSISSNTKSISIKNKNQLSQILFWV